MSGEGIKAGSSFGSFCESTRRNWFVWILALRLAASQIVVLQRGAALVHAIARRPPQLHWRLRNDPRVLSREGCNARFLEASDLSPQPALAVGDVSFISLTVILPAVFKILPEGGNAIFLIKPQFEVPKGSLPPGGVVREESTRLECIEKIRLCVAEHGHEWLGCIASPITGRDGNIEYLAHIKRHGGFHSAG
jgi:23S rRNA (cytidine1920-2'-O)/16S rRNA (cytidine1409-2'-O)-methyltransferase